MYNLDILNFDGSKVDSFEFKLPDVSVDPSFLLDCYYKVNKMSFTKTACTKTKVSKTTKKAFRQKGTGNARQGALDGPHMRGGRVSFGPVAVQRTVKIQSSEIKRAKIMILKHLIDSKKIALLNDINLESPKTKHTSSVKSAFSPDASKMIVYYSESLPINNHLSARNVRGFKYSNDKSIKLIDLFTNDFVAFTKESFQTYLSSIEAC